MFLPWSLISRGSKKHSRGASSGSRVQDRPAKKPLRQRRMQLELLEDRIVPVSKNIFVDASYNGANGTSDGSITKPWLFIQDGLTDARNNPGPDRVFVYGNND